MCMANNYSESKIWSLLEGYFSIFQKQWNLQRDIYASELHERIFHYEKEILTAFGLPLNAECYLFLFDKTTFCFNNQYTLSWLFTQLSHYSNGYQTLEKKSYSEKDPFVMLPKWNVPVNSYTVFLHNQMINKNANEIAVWKEFDLLKNNNRITEIYLLCFDHDYHQNPLFKTLIDYGMKHLPVYLKWYHKSKTANINL